jgi:hypothetical protein
VTNLAVHLDVSNLNLTPEPGLSSFKVGNVVEVARRKQPGVNEEGGVAEIMEVNSRRGQVLYRVRYVLDKREENELDDSILKLWVSPAGRPTRSIQSSQQGSSAQFNLFIIFTYIDSHYLMAPITQLKIMRSRGFDINMRLKKTPTEMSSSA